MSPKMIAGDEVVWIICNCFNHCHELVSIIINSFNQGHYLDDAIESVIDQTIRQAEIVVVDDGSTDSTAEVAHSYPQASYVYQHNHGISSARNAGLRAS